MPTLDGKMRDLACYCGIDISPCNLKRTVCVLIGYAKFETEQKSEGKTIW